jgi:hypothetical protein
MKTDLEAPWIEVFCDSDHVKDISNKANSIGGYYIKIKGVLTAWSCNTAHAAQTNATDTELIVLERSLKKALILGKILVDMKLVKDEDIDVVLHEDNKGAFDTLNNRYGTQGVRHLRIKLAWIRELVDDGIVKILKIQGTEQPADILTKLLPGSGGFYKHSGTLNDNLRRHWVKLGLLSQSGKVTCSSNSMYKIVKDPLNSGGNVEL